MQLLSVQRGTTQSRLIYRGTPAEQFKLEEDGTVQYYAEGGRNIFAEDETFVATEKKVCATPEEIVNSNNFRRFLELYQRICQNEHNRERRAISDNQVPQSAVHLLTDIQALIAGETDVPNIQSLAAQIDGLWNVWLTHRSRFQVIKDNGTTPEAAQLHEDFNHVLKALVTQVNTAFTSQQIDRELSLDVEDVGASTGTVRGNWSHSNENVFRVHAGTDNFRPAYKTNHRVSRAKREGKAPIEKHYEIEVPDEGEILGAPKNGTSYSEIVEGQTWVCKELNLGGLKVEVYLADNYSAQHLAGLEALMGGDDIPALPGSVKPTIKLYFGVDPEKMGGAERAIFPRTDKVGAQLCMMISAMKGHHPDRPGIEAHDLNPGEELYHFNDYFGYMKKSLLSLKNMWLLMLTAVSSKQHYLKNGDRDLVTEMKGLMPDQFAPMFEHLYEIIQADERSFEGFLPQVKIPEIQYNPNREGFDPTRYMYIPVHGAAYSIRWGNDTEPVNYLVPGDSGVGKSEILRHLEIQGAEIVNITADDMLYVIFDRESGKSFMIGGEGGAFTKTDDIDGMIKDSVSAPLAGQNADWHDNNRRVIESGVANPLEPKKVDHILQLINAWDPKSDEWTEPTRIKNVGLDEGMQTWEDGPYCKSSSVQGGGTGSSRSDQRWWNEFGVPNLDHVMTHSINAAYRQDPSQWGGKPVTAEQREAILKERNRLAVTIVNTHHTGKQADLEETFKAAGDALANDQRERYAKAV